MHEHETKVSPRPVEGDKQLRTELEQVSARIDEMLTVDPFPASIEPSYLKEAVTAYPARGGKRLRPAIVFWACGLCGGELQKARYAALAVELFHNWTLIHDDIIDQDAMRRGEPTCHLLLSDKARGLFPRLDDEHVKVFGRDMAILAGDILQGWAAAVLGRLRQEDVDAWRVQTLLDRMNGWLTPRLISGEAMDVELGHRTEVVSRRHVEYAMQLKTGVLLAYAAEAGAILSDEVSGLESSAVSVLHEFGLTLGLAFQLQDDYLGLYGAGEKLGKDIGSDLREGRITYPVVSALEVASPQEQEELSGILRARTSSEEEINRAYAIIARNSGDKATLQRTEELFAAAEALLAKFPAGTYRHLFEELVKYLRQRQS